MNADIFKDLEVPLSISDDDLCATCSHLDYNPGGESMCGLRWPGLFDGDGYCQECPSFSLKGGK